MIRRRRAFYALTFVLGAGLATAGGVAWWASSEIVHPSRRSLQAYHQEILATPAKFGLIVRAFDAPGSTPSDQPTPCLLCEPDTTMGPGERGSRVRDQLAAKGVVPPAHGQMIGTVVIVHGRKGRKEDGLPVAERFCAAGLRCLLIDTPAHGDNLNPLASYGLREWSLPDLAMREAVRRFGIPATPRALWGISQGGSVCLHAAAKTSWESLIVVSSFARLGDVCVAQSRKRLGPLTGPLYEAVESLVEFRAGYRPEQIRPIDLVPGLQMPVMIAHGTKDDLIPTASGHELYDALPGVDKLWMSVDGGTHDRVLTTPMPLYAEMAAFYLAHLPDPT